MPDNKMRIYIPILATLAAFMAPACSLGPGSGHAAPIAQVGQREILLGDFEAMLQATTAGNAPDLVRSRLLDQYVDREVLLQEARRRRIQVEDADLDRAMARDGRLPDDAAYREKLRAALIVESLLRIVLEESSKITATDEERFFEENPELFHQPKLLVLRQILLDDGKSAAALREQLVQEPERFVEAARRYSISADGGSLRAYAPADLPREVSIALHSVGPGGISPVVEMPPGFLIFLVEERRAQRSISLEEARPAIQMRLQEARGESVRTLLLAELRLKLDVRLYEENLPFRYIEEGPA